MDDREPIEGVNPYDSPREHAYYTPEDLAWWSWFKDRLMLWGCGWAVFLGIWGTVMMVVAIRWLLGYPI